MYNYIGSGKMLKKNKKIFVFISIIIFSLLLLLFIIRFNNGYDKNLVLNCEQDEEFNNINFEVSIKVYRGKDSLKLVNTSKSIIKEQANNIFSSKNLQQLSLVLKKQQEDEIIEMFGENYKYIEYNVNQNDNSIETEFIYNINEVSSIDMYRAFEYDLYHATDEDIKDYFEGDGFTCKKY